MFLFINQNVGKKTIKYRFVLMVCSEHGTSLPLYGVVKVDFWCFSLSMAEFIILFEVGDKHLVWL